MSKHTGGPWCIETPMGDHELWIVEANREAYEWHCLAIIPAQPEDENDLPREIALANARLIAAAPDMLAALKLAVARADEGLPKYSGRTPECQADYDACIAAITKAIGE